MAKSLHRAAEFRAALRIFVLFGHPLRLIVFQRLARKPKTASELARELPLTRTGVLRHLKLLQAAALVDSVSSGRRRIYRATPAGLAPLSRWLDRQLDNCVRIPRRQR